LIEWCLTPTLAVFQLYRRVTKINVEQFIDMHLRVEI